MNVLFFVEDGETQAEFHNLVIVFNLVILSETKNLAQRFAKSNLALPSLTSLRWIPHPKTVGIRDDNTTRILN